MATNELRGLDDNWELDVSSALARGALLSCVGASAIHLDSVPNVSVVHLLSCRKPAQQFSGNELMSCPVGVVAPRQNVGYISRRTILHTGMQTVCEPDPMLCGEPPISRRGHQAHACLLHGRLRLGCYRELALVVGF